MRDAARAGTAGLVALAVIAVSVFAHVLAGGAAHLASPLFAPFALVALAACIRMSRREWTLPRLLAMLGVSQIVLHYAMQLTDPNTAAMASSMATRATNMTDAAIVEPVSLLDSAGPMVLAHLAAIAIATVVVLHSERWISALEALLTYVIPTLAEPVAAPHRDAWTRLPVRTSNWVPAIVLRDARINRRGPPNGGVPTLPAFV